MAKRICILAFSRVARDARVLRQIEYLSQKYAVDVVGYGEPHISWTGQSNVHWRPVVQYSQPAAKKLRNLAVLSVAPLWNRFYDLWYWDRPQRKQALEIALSEKFDVYHANDWDTLPIAAIAAEHYGARLILDLHEFSPLEYEEAWYWPLYRRAIEFVLRKYQKYVNASVTVAKRIADRYRSEYELDPIVVLNAPRVSSLPSSVNPSEEIRLIHHGSINTSRRPELLIEAVAQCDPRFSLSLMLTNDQSREAMSLRALAARIAPRRVSFIDPVPPEAVVKRIAEFDVGLAIVYPSNYNNLVCLPNKFWDFIAAGLAVCSGPSPSMVDFIREFNFGCVADRFEARDLANTLNNLDRLQVDRMRAAARSLSQSINADSEMAKLTGLYQTLLGE